MKHRSECWFISAYTNTTTTAVAAAAVAMVSAADNACFNLNLISNGKIINIIHMHINPSVVVIS